MNIFKLLAIFAIAFSLATLGGPLSSNFHLPTLLLGHAIPQTGPCMTTGSSGAASECWYPAGPSMSTLLINIYSDPVVEYSQLLSSSTSIDFTDSPVPTGAGSQLSGPGYYLTSTIPALNYQEIEFNQANIFWNCNFNFGNSPCGIQIRQGIAHMIDKAIFAAQDPSIPSGFGIPIDNPVPTTSAGNLLSADSCLWDSSFPEPNTAGAACTVGGGNGQSLGGASYHRASAAGADGFSWLQAPGSLDLNAAAQHFVNAGLATGFNPSTSVLTNPISTTSLGFTLPNFFIRNDNLPLYDLGNTIALQICYLFTGAYTESCVYLSDVVNTRGRITAFPGLYPSAKTVVYDSGASGTYAAGDPVLSGTAPSLVTNLSVDSAIKFVDTPPAGGPNAPGIWAAGKTVIYDIQGAGTYQTGDTVLSGTAPPLFTNLSVDSKLKFVDTPPATPNAPGTWAAGKTVVYDGDATGTYTSSDTVISGTTPPLIVVTNLSVDSAIKFVDTPPAAAPNTPGTWVAGKTVVYDGDATGTYTSSDTVISGTSPIPGTNLSVDSKLKFVDTPAATTPNAPGIYGIQQNWSIYTAAFNGPTFYDRSLYSTYNSRFVSGFQSIKPPTAGATCNMNSLPTASPADYTYLCSPTYDSLSASVETSPCLFATGDPVAGATSNLPTSPGGICPGTTSTLSSQSAGIQAEDYFGQNVFTLPVFELKTQNGYLQCQPPGPCTTGNTWTRVINDAGLGQPNHFTWLNAWNPSPAISGTIRQGFGAKTNSISPYIASTPWDTYVVDNVYDSLYARNPLATSQFFNWMTENTFPLSSVSYSSGGVTTAPPGTAVTYRFTLRPDLAFQDGRPVTSYDAAFSYLSLVGSGSFLGTLASVMTGITILSPTVFDIGVSSTGPFVLPNLTSLPIVSARYWTNAGSSSWDSAVNGCSSSPCADVQFTLSGATVNCLGACTGVPSSLMTITPADLSASFDPIASHILVGSGPWQCGTVTNSASGVCTSTGSQNPPIGGYYSLTAFTNYFRSSQRLAIYIWSRESDINAIVPATDIGSCFNSPVNLSGPCGHWQQGAGNPGSGTPVGITTVGVDIFYNLNWVAPFEWTPSIPQGIAPLNPILYGLVPFDGSTTYTPNPGGNSCTIPNTYYDC
jgi:hypothetical protein